MVVYKLHLLGGLIKKPSNLFPIFIPQCLSHMVFSCVKFLFMISPISVLLFTRYFQCPILIYEIHDRPFHNEFKGTDILKESLEIQGILTVTYHEYFRTGIQRLSIDGRNVGDSNAIIMSASKAKNVLIITSNGTFSFASIWTLTTVCTRSSDPARQWCHDRLWTGFPAWSSPGLAHPALISLE